MQLLVNDDRLWSAWIHLTDGLLSTPTQRNPDSLLDPGTRNWKWTGLSDQFKITTSAIYPANRICLRLSVGKVVQFLLYEKKKSSSSSSALDSRQYLTSSLTSTTWCLMVLSPLCSSCRQQNWGTLLQSTASNYMHLQTITSYTCIATSAMCWRQWNRWNSACPISANGCQPTGWN